jgi:hypothetical protein
MNFKFLDEIMQEIIIIDARDIKEIFLNNGKIYVENMDGIIFITEKIVNE